jgi:putative membrane protein
VTREEVEHDVVARKRMVGGLLMLLSMVIFSGGLILIVMWSARQFTPGSGGDRPDPKTILEERFARGEIAKEELEEGRRVLDR